MAKPSSIKIRLNSTANTGFFYVTKKNSRTMTEKMEIKKFDLIIIMVRIADIDPISFGTEIKKKYPINDSQISFVNCIGIINVVSAIFKH